MRSYAVRLGVLRMLVVAVLLALLGRLWFVQVLDQGAYRQAAVANTIRSVVLPAERGRILDAQGRVLVGNRTALEVTVDRSALARRPDGGASVLRRLAGLLGVPVGDLRRRTTLCAAGVPQPCWNGSPYQPIPVAEQVDPAVAVAVAEQSATLPGVATAVSAVRSYPEPAGALAAHLLGYVAPISGPELARLPAAQQAIRRNDMVGRAGLEQTYDAVLAGRNGVRRVAVDASGAVRDTVSVQPPRAGTDLRTSLDARVQRVLEDALATGIRSAHSFGQPATTAAGVVLDARTGHVVAMASLPAYRPDAFVGGISTADYRALTDPAAGVPLLDRATQGEYAPGSSFKPVSVAGIIGEGTANFTDSYDCPGAVTLGNRVFHNFEGTPLGRLDLHTAIVKSCDTVFYQFAQTDWYADEARIRAGQPPLEAVQRMALAFGLGRPTGVDLPGEASGSIETRASLLANWRAVVRPNACAGATRRPVGDPLRALDAENCTDGWRFRLGDQANMDIGQGTVLVTPLQLAAAYAALVNGGTVFSPRLGAALLRDGRVLRPIASPVRGRLPVPAAVRDQIVSAMYDVPRWGTAAGAFAGFPLDRIAVGGKTGTAQVANDPAHDTSWFGSFAGPPGAPAQYVTVIVIPGGGQGAQAAAPAVRAVWAGLYGADGRPPALPGLLAGGRR